MKLVGTDSEQEKASLSEANNVPCQSCAEGLGENGQIIG